MDSDTREPLRCQEMVTLVTDYLEHALLPQVQALFEQHLDGCEGCKAYLRQMQHTISLLRRLSGDVPLPAARPHLLALFQQWKQSAP